MEIGYELENVFFFLGFCMSQNNCLNINVTYSFYLIICINEKSEALN